MKLENIIKENMIRFRTKNLSESNKKILTEQEKAGVDAILNSVRGINTVFAAAADKIDKTAGVTGPTGIASPLLVHRILAWESPDQKKRNTSESGEISLYFMNKKTFEMTANDSILHQGTGTNDSIISIGMPLKYGEESRSRWSAPNGIQRRFQDHILKVLGNDRPQTKNLVRSALRMLTQQKIYTKLHSA